MPAFLLEIATSPATQEGAVDFTMLFIKMMGALAVVCILAVFILKYAVPRLGLLKKFSGSKYIEIIARHSLDHRKHLYIIKIGARYALIGSSEHGVSHIMDLDRKDVEG